MLAKKFKIASSSRIKYVIQKGRRINGSRLRFAYLPNREDKNRFCVTVTKKINDKAVERNRLRRIAYEAIGKNWPLDRKPCYDVCVLYKSMISPLKLKDIEKDIIICAQQIT